MANPLVSELMPEIVHAFQYDLRRKFANAANKGLVGANRQIEEFARGLQANFGNAADTAEEFSKIAALMREELVKSYDERVADEEIVPSYRIGAGRYAGGALRRALADPSMAVGDSEGISYINRVLLASEAKHWRRLNFGAGGAASSGFPGLSLLPVHLDKRILFYVGSQGKPRPAFTLPPGLWRDPTHGTFVGNRLKGGEGLSHSIHEFFPMNLSGASRVNTRGIAARHFIDAGFEVIANEFGPALDRLFRKWTEAATDSVRNVAVNVLAE